MVPQAVGHDSFLWLREPPQDVLVRSWRQRALLRVAERSNRKRTPRSECASDPFNAVQLRGRRELLNFFIHHLDQAILLLDLAVLQLEAFIKWLENCDEELRLERQS